MAFAPASQSISQRFAPVNAALYAKRFQMLTVEKDENAEQVFIHGSPEELRWLASRLEAIASQAEKSGNSHDHFMTENWGGHELTTELIGNPESHKIINHLVIYGHKVA
ncbi:Imm32 family immunity protein [Parashewanella tropica]|uniref:Imm32 family immunity protein n=1 Tax=Parashewanella tropica TaxID=2547970 RepID=UPI0011E4DD10|nr:Imm32 family immunity protein [Parashewanella tropica]